MDLDTLQLTLETIENLHDPGLSKEGIPLLDSSHMSE